MADPRVAIALHQLHVVEAITAISTIYTIHTRNVCIERFILSWWEWVL